jgi:hypothetical protein
MSLTSNPITLTALVVAALLIAKRFLLSVSRPPLPPGPPGYPLVGNAYKFPRERRWFTFAKWARQYGMWT